MGISVKQTEKVALVLGYDLKGKTIYGSKNDYHFSLNATLNYNVVLYVLTFSLDKMLSDEKLKSLRKGLKVTINLNKHNDANFLNISFSMPTSNDKKKKRLDDILEKVTNALKEEDIHEYEKCLICNSENEEEKEWDIYQGLYLNMHKSCIENERLKEIEALKEEDKNIVRLPISIVLAIVGAFVGAIPAIIIMLVSGWLIGILFALSPLGAFLGYKLGKAPLRWYSTMIAIVASVLATIIFICLLYMLLATAEGVTFSKYISDSENQFLILLLQSLLFDGVGVAIAWRYISKGRN